MTNYYYILTYLWFFLFAIIGASTYYEKFARVSLRTQFIKIVEDNDVERKNWTERPLTKEELEKTDLYYNKPLVFDTTVYSTKEEKLADLRVTLLLQQGGENSLLNRGIYF
uniref:Uncharacterized protein n=1 Tax=Phalansterium sp. PJK-2012 TaxID=1267188 RepID=T1QE53_9EUKA|nr:hypothetical protein [Phalansterium sp. PJK-2012]